ncbi:hypothetical protein V494_00626, partial [Pseudogymnoascus sp. VKM F-4513 (FW-928)]
MLIRKVHLADHTLFKERLLRRLLRDPRILQPHHATEPSTRGFEVRERRGHSLCDAGGDGDGGECEGEARERAEGRGRFEEEPGAADARERAEAEGEGEGFGSPDEGEEVVGE